ncbi:MAG: 16S rRNA (cytosine(1402)-N(4))-methyltransferase RsmH [Candidatus Kerfeldbacteria bacterium]|nr:16S rRNA (cytosine(1402)-N(4))-methyltransferase RsmH [Candidatus Kerfeldbacteria bacterium]
MLGHIPVLQHEVLALLDPRPGQHTVDVTLGAGGHAAAILERTAPDGQLLGIDLDPLALTVAQKNLAKFDQRVTFVHGASDDLAAIIRDRRFSPVHYILADLGLSSLTLGDPTRGFSFQATQSPLDMRFDPTSGRTAADILNSEREDEIADLIYQYGEERDSRRIARSIVTARRTKPFATVGDLLAVFPPGRRRSSRINPATKTFQALRIAVNDELGRLERLLPQAVESLVPGGRLAIISFHSLEDRIVKQFFREQARAGRVTLLTKHPAAPSFAEVTTNPRSRSAKLRAVVRNPTPDPSP